MSDELTPSSDFFTDVRCILADARRAAYTAVNSAMVAAFWQIGRRIVEEEQGGSAKSTYGDRLLPELSRALTAEFGRGFSYANLRNFRQFHLTYPDPEICYTLRSNLSWTHHRLIMRVETRTRTPRHRTETERRRHMTHSEIQNLSRQSAAATDQQSSIVNLFLTIHHLRSTIHDS
jgi:hypothetical protein